MFYWGSKIPGDKWRFDKTDPHGSVCLSKSNVFLQETIRGADSLLIFVDLLKLKTNFIAKGQLLYMVCPLTRECVNTEFDWEVKRGFEKASLSRTVRLRECPLAES